MTCLACNKTHPGETVVTLHDGTQVSSYSEEWRSETEARAVINFNTRQQRMNYLEGVEQKRGIDASIDLKASIVMLFPKEKRRGVLQVVSQDMQFKDAAKLRGIVDARSQRAAAGHADNGGCQVEGILRS